MSRNGFIIMWRDFANESCFKQNPIDWMVWSRLILDANWGDTERVFATKRIKIRRGQVLIIQRTFAKECGIALSTLQRSLKRLERCGHTRYTSDTHGTLVTIVNYNRFCTTEKQAGQEQVTTEVVTNAETVHRVPGEDLPPYIKEEEKEEKKEDLGPVAPEGAGSPAALKAGLVVESQPQLNQNSEFKLEAPIENKNQKPDPARQKQIELAVWREALYLFSKLCYAECGLDTALYPPLKGKVSGLMGNYIKKLGGENYHEGAKKLHAIIQLNADWYDEKGEYWHPSISSILSNVDKVAKIQAQSNEITVHLPDSPFDYKLRCKELWDEFLSEQAENPVDEVNAQA